jgi:LysM repeat protein
MNKSKAIRLLFLSTLPAIVLILGFVLPVGASPNAAPMAQMTDFPTPTPGPDGRIVYIVQQGDSLWRIAAVAGISIQELAVLNDIDTDTVLSPGTRLVLGVAGPPQATQATPEAGEPTAEGTQATATPISGTGEICVLLFEDANGNGRLDDGEAPIEGGQISVTSLSGTVVGEHTTVIDPADEDLVGYCFAEIENGEYNVSAALPEDYNATTVRSLPVRLSPGEIAYLQFGAQSSTALIRLSEGSGTGSTVLGALGVVFLLLAGVLGYFAYRSTRRKPRGLM